MKKANVLIPQLIVALVALAGSVVNFLGLFMEIAPWLSIVSAGVMLAASALWLILYFVNAKKIRPEEPVADEITE